MSGLLYTSYVVAAATIFWSLWRFIGLTNLSTHMRCVLFVLGGTLWFTPVLTPVAAVAGGSIPSGAFLILLRTGSLEDMVGGNRNVLQLLASCAGITAVLLGLVAVKFTGPAAGTARWNWTYPAFPGVSTALTLALVALTIPTYDTRSDVTEPRLEKVYGRSLDAVEALRRVDDPESWFAEASRLNTFFKADPTIVEVSLSEKGNAVGSRFILKRGPHFGATDCTYRSVGPDLDLRVRECISQPDGFADLETLRYIRRGSTPLGGTVVVVFDYDQLLKRLSGMGDV